MIDVNIEKAAKTSLNDCVNKKKMEHEIVILGRGDYIEAFKSGISWFLDSLWHPMSESPKMGSEILIKINKKAYEGSGVNPSSTIVHEYDYHDDWEFYAKDARFLQWMYTDDLQTI